MAFSFPDSPTLHDTYAQYTWDGEKWSFSADMVTGTAFVFPDAPTPLDTYAQYTWDGEKWSLAADIVVVDTVTFSFIELFGITHLDQLFTLPWVP